MAFRIREENNRQSEPSERRQTATPSAPSPDVRVVVCIAIVLCASLMLKIALATGACGGDDMSYFRGAEEILQQGWIPQIHHHFGRKVYILLAGIPAALGGHVMYGALANIGYVEILEVALTLFVFRQFGARAALVAAIVQAFNEPELAWSSTLLPDMMLALFVFLSVAALYYALLPTAERPVRLVAAGGLCAGLGYAVKEPGILLIAPAALSLLALRPDVPLAKRAAWIFVYMVAFACIYLADGLLQLGLSGDFLYRRHAIDVAYNLSSPPLAPLDFVRHVYWSLAAIVTTYDDVLLLPMAAGVIASVALILRRSSATVFAVSGIFLVGYLTAGSTSFPQLRPMFFQPRYFAPMFPLLAVCLAALYARQASRTRIASALWQVFLLAFLVTSFFGLIGEAGDLARSRYFKNAAAALQSQLAQTAKTPIMVDQNVLDTLVDFLPSEAFARLKPIPADRDLPAGFYLIDPIPYDPDNVVRFHVIPHEQEIRALPVVATFNLNPLLISRYFPNYGVDRLNSDPDFVATLRYKN